MLDRVVTVQPGGFAEANLEMVDGDEITYAWSTANGTVLGFDVHSHDGREVVVHQQATASEGAGTFQAPANGTYSLLWEDQAGEAANLTVRIEGAFTLDSFHS